MQLTLGIDTGGTFTDGVLLELETGKVVKKAKAFTTREDLSLGIRECVANLDWPDWSAVRLVSLSTTLATNAVVEGRGCRVGLVLIGHDPIGPLPAQKVFRVDGGHDIKGIPLAGLDTAQVHGTAADMRGQVDTVAVSGYFSIRNPEHELAARRIVQQVLDVPVVCAHQLTTELGFHERSVTACLNASLLPIIVELLVAVKKVLGEQGIKAPLMVVKGDGSLMSEEIASERPVETVLSGPAASIVGATFLTGSKDALVLDMGGTTTDIAILENGRPKLKREGALVGGWHTRVEAAEITTFGLGGDSYIQVSPDRRLKIGPKRVWSLAAMAERYPYMNAELSRVNINRDLIEGQPVDCYFLLKPPEPGELSGKELQLVEALQDGAHNVFSLAERLETDPIFLPTKGLESRLVIGRISLTPTDILHAAGIFAPWNRDVAKAATRLQAARMGMEYEEFIQEVLFQVRRMLGHDIIQSLLWREGSTMDLEREEGATPFLSRSLSGSTREGWGAQVKLEWPIVAIGAPVSAYLPAVGSMFSTRVHIPDHAEVANAVGAAVGQVVECVKVVIKPGAGGGFVIHAPWGMEGYVALADAEEQAVVKARAWAADKAHRSGAHQPEILVEKEEGLVETARGETVFLETRVQVTAVGRPEWGN